MADTAPNATQTSVSLTGSGQQHQSFPLTPVTSNAQTSSASSSDSVQVFSKDSRSRSNTPSSLASSIGVTSPEYVYDQAKAPPSASHGHRLRPFAATADSSLEQRSRSSSHESNASRPSPNAEALNSGHHVSQTLDTIPQAALPPPVVDSSPHTNTEDHEDLPAAEHREHINPPDAWEQHDHGEDLRNINPDRSNRTDSWRTAAVGLSEMTRRRLRNNGTGQKLFGAITLTLTIIGTVYLSFRAYTLQKWQAVAELYNFCQNVKVGQGGYKRCQDMLKTPLGDPPYSNIAKQMEVARQRRQKRGLALETSNKAPDWVLFTLLGLGLLILAYTYLMWLFSRSSRQQTGSDPVWRVRRLWPVNRQQSDHFSPVNVRIAPLHHQMTVPQTFREDKNASRTKTQDQKPTLPNHLRQKRQLHILSAGMPQGNGIKRKSLTSDESLTETPPWKHGGLPRSDSISLKDPDDASNIRSELIEDEQERPEDEQPVQIGDTLKGIAENDLTLKATNSPTSGSINYVAELRRRLHTRYPNLPYFLPDRDDQPDDEPILTALGTDPCDSFDPEDSEDTYVIGQRKNVVLSGFVAVAMAQAGSALASTAGGAIGRNILVQNIEDEAHDIHEMITTGKKRRPTDLAEYEAEKQRFLDGSSVKRRVTRQESTTIN